MQWKGNKLLSETKKHLNKSLHTEVKTTVKYQKKKKTGNKIPTKR